MVEEDGFRKSIEYMAGFMRYGSVRLRKYQTEVAEAVIDSIQRRDGLSLVVMFPRQSGKNELQAQLEAYLLTYYSIRDLDIVKIAPTWRPQSLHSMRRLERVLQANRLTEDGWTREKGFMYRIGRARIIFLSGAREANIVGATASLLLEVDEAQGVNIEKFDQEIAPMAASTNATRVFWGTAWTTRTLLARELRASLEQEKADGIRRVFRLTADDVSREVPSYARFVAGQVARFGRNHPTVRTQYFSEEIADDGRLFPPERMAMMEGSHAWEDRPRPGRVYAFLLDVGGEAQGVEEGRLSRDSTALVIAAVEFGSPAGLVPRAPTYQVVHLRLWTGEKQTRVYEQVAALARTWQARRLVIDATGLGEGLASFLDKALPGRLIRFVFNTKTKSRLGRKFLEVVESGRFQLPRAAGSREMELVELFKAQCRGCTYQVGERPAQALRWSVPDGERDPESGELLHDDLLLAGALCGALDEVDWPLPGGGGTLIQGKDPLDVNEGF